MSVIAENRANKKTTLTDNSDVFYPSQKAVKTAVDAKVDKTALLSTPSVTPLDTNALSEKYIVDNLAKYTKMPDGATAVYSQDAWATTDSWEGASSTLSLPVAGVIRATMVGTGAGGLYRIISAVAGKIVVFRYRLVDSQPWILRNTTSFGVELFYVPPSSEWSIIRVQSGVPFTSPYFRRNSGTDGGYIEIDWIWIGDYSYLDNSLSTEASRIANQLGDTTGVGTKASGAITNNLAGPLVDGETITLGGLVYTFKDTLTGAYGEVKIQTATNDTLLFLATLITNGGDGNIGKALQNPLLTATYQSGGAVNLYARKSGILGNSITLATTASTLTLSGPTLTGGTDDVGAKVITQLESSYKGTPKFNGISFPATQVPSADPNTLDDYEEGTWTPTLIGSTTAGTQTYTTQYGFYTKIGNLVTISGFVAISAKGGTMAGNTLVGGMPFAVKNATGVYCAGFIRQYSGFTFGSGYTQLMIGSAASQSTLILTLGGSAKSVGVITTAETADATSIIFSITYPTA